MSNGVKHNNNSKSNGNDSQEKNISTQILHTHSYTETIQHIQYSLSHNSIDLIDIWQMCSVFCRFTARIINSFTISFGNIYSYLSHGI